MTEGEKSPTVTRLVIDYSEVKAKIALLYERLRNQGERVGGLWKPYAGLSFIVSAIGLRASAHQGIEFFLAPGVEQLLALEGRQQVGGAGRSPR